PASDVDSRRAVVQVRRQPRFLIASCLEDSMLKKLCYAAAIGSVALISAGITAAVMQGQARKSPVIPGFDHPNPLVIQQPTRLKKHELFSEDHTADVVAIQQVWAAYTFYNDAADGAGMASIFTEDGVDQHL